MHVPGVTVHELQDHFGPLSLARIERAVMRERGAFQLLIQYVPHMYGYKGMNVGLAWWIKRWRALNPWVMFHEVAYARTPGQFARHRLLSHVQQTMARWVAKSAARRFVSIPLWQPYLEEIVNAPVACEWLPVPSNVETTVDSARVDAIKHDIVPGPSQRIVAHFGTYFSWIADELARVIAEMMHRDPEWFVLLLGRGSAEFAGTLIVKHPEWKGRIHATGGIPASEVAAHLAAADVLYQPYPDGVSSRRGSTMAGLALGLPIVTNSGHLSETIWRDERCVVLVDLNDRGSVHTALEAYSNPSCERTELMIRANAVYERHFSWDRTIEHLRRTEKSDSLACPPLRSDLLVVKSIS